MLLNIEGFQYATSLDLNMGYFYISLGKQVFIRKQEINACTIILPWIIYKYKRLPMRECNSPEILQAKMNEIFCVFDFIIAYIYDLLIINKGDWSNHLN